MHSSTHAQPIAWIRVLSLHITTSGTLTSGFIEQYNYAAPDVTELTNYDFGSAGSETFGYRRIRP